MPLQVKSYQQFLSDIVTQWASLVKLSPNLQPGDPLLAIFQAIVLCGLMFVQAQNVKVNRLTRAATSDGADLDSWMADFSFLRKPASYASGEVQFSLRGVLSTAILIPPGKIIQTLDGSIQYQVIADTDQSAWSVEQNAYVLPAGQLSLRASVQAISPGSASNVQQGALCQMASSITGVSFVTNLSPIQNGRDVEADQPLRDRFKLFITTPNGKATPAGLVSVAYNSEGVVAALLLENQDLDGNSRPGYGILVIDDGSGAPSSGLIADVQANVNQVRGNFTQVQVAGPELDEVDIALNVKVATSANQSTVLSNVLNAVLDYVNGLEIGAALYLQNISQVAKDADPGVVAVQTGTLLINGNAADHIGSAHGVIRTDNTRTTVGTW